MSHHCILFQDPQTHHLWGNVNCMSMWPKLLCHCLNLGAGAQFSFPRSPKFPASNPGQYTLNSVVSHLWQPECTYTMEFCIVKLDAWYYRTSVACDIMEYEFILLSPPLVWSTPLGLPGQCGICMHQHSTSGIRKRRRRRRIRRWHSTYWHMAQCEGVGWLLWWCVLMTKFVI